MTSLRLWLLGNLLANQLVWAVAVVGAAQGSSVPGVLGASLFLLLHLALLRDWRGEARFIGMLVLVGYPLDCLMSLSGLIEYRPANSFAGIAPPWILGLWVSIAATARHSLRPLLHKTPVAAVFGLLGAPFAYYTASVAQAITLPEPVLALALIGLAWAILLVALRRYMPVETPERRRFVLPGEAA